MMFFSSLFLSRMRERDLQGLCRRALLLTVCMLSLWGQLTSASSHRSHIGTLQCTCSLGVCPSGASCSETAQVSYYKLNSASQKKARIKSDFSCSFIHSFFFFPPLSSQSSPTKTLKRLEKEKGGKNKACNIFWNTMELFSLEGGMSAVQGCGKSCSRKTQTAYRNIQKDEISFGILLNTVSHRG